MRTVPLFEIAYTEAPQVDREAGVIRGVRILGRASRNGREYSDSALAQAARLYEGLGVNLNHRGREQRAGERAVEDGLGWLQEIEVRADGVYGDLHYFRTHPQAGLLVEAAERNPRRFGLSHHAEGRVEKREGKWVVESIASVKSVDVVQNPATNRGLFEEADDSANLTARDVLRTAPELLAALAEDVVLAPSAEGRISAPDDPDDLLATAVRSLAVNLLENEQLSLLDRLRHAHRVLNAHHELGAGRRSAVPEAGGLSQPPDPAEPANPIVAQLLERLEQVEAEGRCRLLLEAADRACTAERLSALVPLTDDDERRRLIDAWPERQAAASLRQRPAVSRPLHESRDERLRFPESNRAFVAAIR
ncbi:MAG: hypothetical protein ACT4QC_22125 [Planctomycetaceae bacterium]